MHLTGSILNNLKIEDTEMSTINCKRAVLVEAAKPIEIWEYPMSEPGAGEILLKGSLSGICGTDVHLCKGEIPLPGPIVLGHEGIGLVEKMGAGVSTDFAGVPLSQGDRVYYVPLTPCNRCYFCTIQKDTTNCESALGALFTPAQHSPVCTHSEYSLLPANIPFYRIPDDTPSEAVVAFGCAMPTILQGMERIDGIKLNQAVVVQGLGPVGQSATLLSSISGAKKIIVIDGNDARLGMAKNLGATDSINFSDYPTAESRVARVRELTGGRGADVVIEAVGLVEAFSEGIQLVAKNGSYLVCGLWSAPGSVSIEPRLINNMNMRIKGTSLYEGRHVANAIGVAQAYHDKYPMTGAITHRFALDDMQQALDAVAKGAPIKAVIAF
jgi:threonine dehydrogenase-like Zn-dependent dehydrogenase